MRWIGRTVIVSAVLGAAGFVYFLIQVASHGAATDLLRHTPMFLLLWQALAAATAALVVLGGTVYQRARRRPLSLPASRGPRVIAAITGASIAGAALTTVLYRPTSEMLLLAAAGLGLVGVAARGATAPWPAKHAIVALLASILLVTLPREADWLSISMHRSHTETDRHHSLNESCNGQNWGRPLKVANVARSIVTRTSLTGNVGELVSPAPQADIAYDNGVAVMHVTGNVDINWLSCLVPLYKSAQVDASLTLQLYVSAHGEGTTQQEVRSDSGERTVTLLQRPHATCSGSGSVQLRIDRTVKGIFSCRDLREQLARHIANELDLVAQQIAGLPRS